MSPKADIEMRWVDAWNALYEIVGDCRDVACQLPDCSVVGVEECKGWLQQSVYEGLRVQVKAAWVGHCKGVVASRWRPGESAEPSPPPERPGE